MKPTTLLARGYADWFSGPTLRSLLLRNPVSAATAGLRRKLFWAAPAAGTAALYDLTFALARCHDSHEWESALCRYLAQRLCVTFAAIVVQVSGSAEIVAASSSQAQEAMAAFIAEAARMFAADPVEVQQCAATHTPFWVPLRRDGMLYGLLAIGPTRDGASLGCGDRQVLLAIVELAVGILHHVRLTEQLRRRTDQLRWLNEQLISAHEDERRALARELHDGPLQRLTLASSLLGSAGEQEARILAQLTPAVAELRTLCRSLRVSLLADLGLVDAIESLVEEMRSVTGATILFSVDPRVDAMPLDDATQAALFRVAQGAMHNCLRHAQATVITVRIEVASEETRPWLRLTIADNGRGFVVPAHLRSMVDGGHFGLAGMAERMDSFGAHFRLRSAPGKGTMVIAEVPASGEGLAHVRDS